MTSDERKSIDNGIWLCNRHSRIVDSDESRFTAEILRHWKRVAEEKARLLQQLGVLRLDPDALEPLGLALNRVAVDHLGHENQIIGDALVDSCMPAIWGENLTHALRDFAIELVRNAFQHGGATQFEVEVTARMVSFRDNGAVFDPTTLLPSREKYDPEAPRRSGGTAAAIALLLDQTDPVVIAHRY